MLPSSTVENYLKAIYQGQSSLARDQRLVPMGHVAAALGVTPGTATTMVKALAESGLAEYEPYSGVRLSAAGEKLAGLVLRRHRLVELFLVQVMGMSWDEVHDEAEQLEHVGVGTAHRAHRRHARTSDPRSARRSDSEPRRRRRQPPLRQPAHLSDWHTAEGDRIADQDPAFLRFIESNDLKPGQGIEVETRDTAADSVLVRKKDRRITIGARAASKLLVEIDR
jgi:DtxR family Mn-dependent transcriptional regulator